MIILVDGKPALIKAGASFELIAENRLFMGRDTYTLTITFPLRDCPQNRKIFGYIERMDVVKEKVFFECSIQDKSFSTVGSLLVTGVSETEVKCQFAEGRCDQTVTDPFEKVYINNLDLGSQPEGGSYTPMQAWTGANEVALPWINNESPTQFNNWVVYEDETYKWDKNVYINRRPATEPNVTLEGQSLSWQPYLIFIAKKICEAIGYTCDFRKWENSSYRHLLICNSLPYTWTEGDLRNYKNLLPKWTVTEFFSKLELLMMCEFDINHKARHIGFEFSKDALDSVVPVEIKDTVEEYTTDIATDNQSCEYIGAKRFAYKECNHPMQPYYACDWFLEDYDFVKEYPTISALISANKRHILTSSDGTQYQAYGDGAYIWGAPNSPLGPTIWEALNHLMYAKDVDRYFVFRSIGVHTDTIDRRPRGPQMYVLQPINVFGSGCEESDDVNTEEIEFVPVCITDTHISEDDDKGYMMYLSFSSYQDETTAATDSISQPLPAASIESGKKEVKNGYYDVIYVAFWEGVVPERGKNPYPMIDSVNITQDWNYYSNHIADLRLFGSNRNIQSQIPLINPKQKFKFSFLSNTIPNPRAIFYIHGQKFLCEKITATFTEDGMSQLLKGEFYPII